MNRKSEGKKKHGMALVGVQDYSRRHPIYLAWVNMRQRVNNPNHPDAKYYGARGIKHCKSWDKFENFYSDMKESYEVHRKTNTSTTLDRVNTNGDYAPENCRWATRKEQSVNRRPWLQNGKLTHV